MAEPRAMNIAVFLDAVMAINGPLFLIPKTTGRVCSTPVTTS